MKKHSNGFTLIELLVVIAIIGILASVVLASLNTARAKGADAAIKSSLVAIRTEAQLYIGESGTTFGTQFYPNNVCPVGLTADNNIFQNGSSPYVVKINQLIDSANARSGGTKTGTFSNVRCMTNNTVTSWAVAATLKSDNTKSWCVDSTGASKQVNFPASNASVFTTTGACI
jgi:prepilin-type N-terminal cleavage/methylation domain-containing protein